MMVKEIHLFSPSTRNVFHQKQSRWVLSSGRDDDRGDDMCLVLQKELMEAELFLPPESLKPQGWVLGPTRLRWLTRLLPASLCSVSLQPLQLGGPRESCSWVPLLLPVCSAPTPRVLLLSCLSQVLELPKTSFLHL